MPCYKPLSAWVCDAPNVSGKCSLTWDIHKTAHPEVVVQVPCGQCIGCRLERSRQWAIRCLHEASLYENNCFITLTFRDERVDANGSLVKADFQKFMKRLRKRFGSGVRYFHCGEYGDENMRPHHHACLFNFDFPDKEYLKTERGVDLFVSPSLVDLWIDVDGVNLPAPVNWVGHYNPLSLGYSVIGSVTFESAAYVARYCTKKIVGDVAARHYVGRVPEYCTMSRRPGIASGWFDKFSSDVYPDGFVVVRNGVVCKPPKFYDSLFEKLDKDAFKKLKEERKEVACANPNNSWQRLEVRHKVKLLKARQLKRSL